MRLLKRIRRLGILNLVIFVLVIALAILGYARYRAKAVGSSIGELTGKATGVVIGSFEGITKGIASGAAAGRETGLSALDTTVVVAKGIQDIGKLEVLAAGVKITDLHKIGEAYTALYLVKGNAVFSVDLNEAKVLRESNKITILIPEPTMQLYIDESGTEKLAEAQKFSFSISAKDGIEAYLNSMQETATKAEELIENYDQLMQTARESAKEQVCRLALLASGSEYEVSVEFGL